MKKSNIFKKIVLFSAALGLSVSTSLFTQKVNATVKTAGEINGNPYVRLAPSLDLKKAFTTEQFIQAAPNWFEGERAETNHIGTLKIHLYKKPHKALHSNNVNLFTSQTFASEGTQYGADAGNHTYDVGTATINGHTYKLDDNGWIRRKSNEQMPATLLYNATGHNIQLYDVESGYADHAYDNHPDNANYYTQGFYPKKYLAVPSNTKHYSTFIVPTHHQAYDILGTRYVPVITHADEGEEGIVPFLIKESDYKSLTKRKHMFIRNNADGTTITQNGNHITSVTDKATLKDEYKNAMDTIKHPKRTYSILRRNLKGTLWSIDHYGSAYFM